MKLRFNPAVKTLLGYGLEVAIVLQGVSGALGAPGIPAPPYARLTVNRVINPLDTTADFPLSFEPNQGQSASRAAFIAHASQYSISLTANEAAISFGRMGCAENEAHAGRASVIRPECKPENSMLRLQFEGASARRKGIGRQPAKAVSNYLIGNSQKKFLTNIRHFGGVRFNEIYPGIDIEYYGTKGQLEYDLFLAPGADTQRIAPRFRGADKVEIDHQGNLLVHFAEKQFTQRKPLAYQIVEGQKVPVIVNYVLRGGTRIGFDLAPYDRAKPLVIDPIINYSTYLGGSNADTGTSVVVDSQGRVYLTGITTSLNFPAPGSSPPFAGSSDIFIAKLTVGGTSVEYTTFLGGQGIEEATGIAVDETGSAYVAGTTGSANFPTTPGSLRTTFAGATDSFLAKLKPDGSGLLYSTFLGGNQADEAYGVALDSVNNACVVGLTDSDNFPTTPSAFQLNKNNESAAFVAKLNAGGSALVYSSYLGGSGIDQGLGIATDSTGNIYVTGLTTSSDFPTSLSALQTTLNGSSNSFVAKFIPSQAGNASLGYSTFLGGGNSDSGYAVAVDSTGNAYVAGSTNSLNFPTTIDAASANKKGSSDVFVAKLNTDGSALSYATYLGGDCADAALGIKVDSSGQASVSGYTLSNNFPVTNDAFQSALAGKHDVFVAKLNADGSGLVSSTYLGGNDNEESFGIALDSSGSVYVTGNTASTNYPTLTPAQAGNSGNGDVFITKLSPGSASLIQFSTNAYVIGEGGGSAQITVTRTDSSGAGAVGYATSDSAGLSECNIVNLLGSSRCDYATSIGTLRFAAGEVSKSIFIPIVDDAYAEGNETFTISLSNASGATLGATSTASITIQDNESVNGVNPVDGVDFFIRQNYIDFLGREPDPAGLAGWRNVLVNCGVTIAPPCDRIEVSAGFFRSEEFQSRGYFIYRFYSAVGRIPLSGEFFPDFAKVSGFLSPDQLEAAKVAYVNEVIARAEFQTKYAATFGNPTGYVDALLQTVGLPNHPSRAGWITLLSNNTATNRALVLRQLVESSEVYNEYYNEAFVIMQYFGYLRRTADGSYLSWVQTMTTTGGDYRIMINGFMNSAEYRKRFGP